MTQHLPRTFASTCVWIKNLSLRAFFVGTLALAFAWVQFLASWALFNFTQLTLACWPIEIVRFFAIFATAVFSDLNNLKFKKKYSQGLMT